MKTLRILKINLLIILFAMSCKENKKQRIENIFTDGTSKKWYSYSIDSMHYSQGFYPYRVFEFFRDGKQIQYINNFTTKKLDTIPKDDRLNPERWFIINDSVVSIDSERNPLSGYYHKNTNKILYCSKDTIILQGAKRSNYAGILILTSYKTLSNNGKN